MIETKKAAIDLNSLAIGILIIGLVVSIGAAVVSNIGTNQLTELPTYRVVNETISPTTAGVKLSQIWVKSVDSMVNASNGATITTGNYTSSISSTNGVATVANTTSSYSVFKATYTVYNISDPRYDLPSDASAGLAEYGNWFKILVIVGVAAVVLALIFMAFGNKSSEAMGTTY